MIDSKTQDGLAKSSLDVVGEAVHSALYSGVQQPYEGVSQLVNHVTSKHLLPDLNLIEAPKEAEFGSARWHAQQIGGAVGMAIPFLAVNGVTRELGSPLLGAASESAGLRLATSIALGGTSGALYEGVFTPVKSDGTDFWSQRGKNALVGGITFATMSGVQGGIEAAEASRVSPEYRFLTQKLSSKLLGGVASGVVGGVVNAEATSIIDGKGAADWKSVAKSAYGYAFVGGALGGYEHFADARRQTSENFLSNGYGRSWPGDSKLQVRSELLGHLVDSKGTVSPQKLSSYLDFLKPDSLGLKTNNYDIGVWEGNERSAILQEIRRRAESPMGNEATLTSSINTLAEATKDWHRNSVEQVHDFLDQAKKKASAANRERLEIAALNSELSTADAHRIITDRDLIDRYPTYKEALRKEFEADADVARAEHYLEPRYEARIKQIQTALNKIADGLGLPHVEFGFLSSDRAGGAYSEGQGKIGVDRDFLRADNLKTQSLDVILHEFTHFEQDNLVIKRLADEWGVGKEPTRHQLDQMAKAYETFAGSPPSRLFLEEVLAKRDGKRLTAEETKRANGLLESFLFYSREGYSKGEFLEADQLDQLRSALSQTTTDEGLGKLRAQLSTDKNLAQLLFGDEAQAGYEPVGAFAAHRTFQQFYDRESAHSLIRSKAAEINPAANRRYGGYIGSKLETDAWSVGLLTQVKARSLGIRAFEWSDMKPDYGLLQKPASPELTLPTVLSDVGKVQTFQNWLDTASLDVVQSYRRTRGIDIFPFNKKVTDIRKNPPNPS